MKTNLQVSFDADKLNALRFYMGKKELSVEDELQAQLDRLYEKMVPVQVREYVESQYESEAPNQEARVGENTIGQETGAGADAIVQEVKEEESAPSQEAKTDEGKSVEKPVRQSKRQREKELAAAQQQEPKQEPSAGPEEGEEENQGMSMSM